MNDKYMEVIYELQQQVLELRREIMELKRSVDNSYNLGIQSSWISFKQIASLYGVSYQAVSKKAYNHIEPDYIKKVDGVLSIPKRLVYKLYEEKQ